MFKFLKRKKKTATSITDDLEQLFSVMISANPQACRDTDEISGSYGPFGLSPTNPIPVHGFFSSETYLRSLRTLEGKRIRWDRVGNTGQDNINMPIDIYNICDESYALLIACIYISPYHFRTSTKAPEGFKLEL